MRRRAFTTTLLTALFALSACGGGDDAPTSTLDPAEVMVKAEADYALYCALCHGDQGEGYAADNANALNHPAFLATSTDEFLRAGIVRGRPGTPMSAWGVSRGGPLDDQSVDGLITLMRSWQDGDAYDVSDIVVEGKASRGAPQYAARCAFCHGDQGQGGAYMSIANPEFLASASDGFIREAIRSGRSGTPMGGYAETLTEQAIDDIVVLIRSWQAPIDTSDVNLPSTDLGDPVLNASGPTPIFPEGRYVSASLVAAQLDAGAKMVVIDARPPLDYVTGHIAGSVSVPFYDVTSFVDQLPDDAQLVVYCGCPHAESTAAAEVMEDNGFIDVKVIDEGYYYWRDEGYPVVEGVEPGPWPAMVDDTPEQTDDQPNEPEIADAGPDTEAPDDTSAEDDDAFGPELDEQADAEAPQDIMETGSTPDAAEAEPSDVGPSDDSMPGSNDT